MKHVRITYATQSLIYQQTVAFPDEYNSVKEDDLKNMAIGVLMVYEADHKNRYLRIIDEVVTD